jgi:hypothetical protein
VTNRRRKSAGEVAPLPNLIRAGAFHYSLLFVRVDCFTTVRGTILARSQGALHERRMRLSAHVTRTARESKAKCVGRLGVQVRAC